MSDEEDQVVAPLAEAGERDAIADIEGFKRVESVQVRLIARQVDLPEPVVEPKANINFRIVPFRPKWLGRGMMTMSDLGKSGTRGQTPGDAPKARPK